MTKNPMYFCCMVLLPLVVVIFFTTMLSAGQPTDMPIGIVDQDNTATTRKLTRLLDSFQTSHVVGHYANMNEAREAIQRGEIYGFLLLPKGTTAGMTKGTQPHVSFYYNGVVMLAGNSAFRDMKTVTNLAAAGVGSAKMTALGLTQREITANLQPIAVNCHMIGNPWANYNVYLSTVMIPGLLMVFIFLLTPYSIGTELKFGHAHEWLYLADNNILTALIGKFLPQTLVYLMVFLGTEFYIYHVLGFPHPGGILPIVGLGTMAVLSAQCFGIFAFGIIPSLRMSMSVCSLWAVVIFCTSGATYPVFAMDPFIQAVSWLFPLRHYYVIYKTNIFNAYPMHYVWINWLILAAFLFLPFFVLRNIRRAMLEYEYIP